MELDVICVGVATLDRIALVDRIPGEDERIVAQPFVVGCGGPAATAAVTLARLGARVGFCGIVGTDDAGAYVRANLEAEGVDVRWLTSCDDVRTTESVVMVSAQNGARTIVTTSSVGPDPVQVPMSASHWLHVDQTGYASVMAAIEGVDRPPLVSVDGGNPIPDLRLDGIELYAPSVNAIREAFPSTDLAGSLVAAMAAGARQVVATDGSAGTHLHSADGLITVPSFPVKALSTMGAGDVFHGALLAGLVDGRDLPQAVQWANAVAALSCRALDGRSGIPDVAETERFLTEMGAPGSGSPQTESNDGGRCLTIS
jgi:sugar/nucleoside kinase (ribokinase family)